MEGSDKLEKQVKFAADTKNNLTFTPLASKPSTAKLRVLWLRYSRTQQYEQLKQELESYQERGGTIKRFFEKEGELIFDEALINAPDSRDLIFMVENVPKELIQEFFQRKTYSLLYSFLRTVNGLEKLNKFNEEHLKVCIEKIKLLLIVEPDIKEILNKSIEDSGLGEGVKKSIVQALTVGSSVKEKNKTALQNFK